MSFVLVKHSDGRTADITAAEVAYYQSIGFAPVDGSVVEGDAPVAPAALPAPVNGTEQRLDLLIGEMRGLRADFAAIVPVDLEFELIDGEPVELREPEVPATEDAAGSEDQKPEPEKASAKAKK